MNETKTCTKCKKVKLKTEFHFRSKPYNHLLQSHCKTCKYEEHKSWVNKNEAKVRVYRAKDPWTFKKRCARHGINEKQFWEIYDKQGGRCLVCEDQISAEISAIDHNHKTKEVRGILCKSCNRALGLLKDSPSNLQRAAQYLLDRGHYGQDQ